MAPALKILYFGMPGRAEATRLCAAVGGLEVDDSRIEREEWNATKGDLTPMQLPLLYVDGKPYGQSIAQSRYVAKLAGMYPSDPLEALRVDELSDYVGDAVSVIAKSFGMQGEEQLKFHGAMVAEGGDLHKWLVYLDKQLEGKKFAVGDSLTLADAVIFTTLQLLRTGWLDGVPTTCLDGFKHIMAHRDAVANHEKVKAYYADATGPFAVYKA